MQAGWELTPLLAAMLVLLILSAFFSASEAALFSLRATDLAILRVGTRGQRRADRLLDDPDRLLSAVLFWNLVVNIGYFAIVSHVGLRLRGQTELGNTVFATFTGGSLLGIIFFSEMLPKSFAVLQARRLSAWLSLPLSAFVRLVDPLMPTLRVVNLLSRRLIWPTFQAEPYLQINDLARAIELSTDDAQLIDQEQRILRNVISLSDLRVDECMCPRAQLRLLRPPVHWRDPRAELSGATRLFIAEPDSDEIVATVDLGSLLEIPDEHLERYSQAVIYAPWSSQVADVLQEMERLERDTAVVVNEMGETIGAVTRNDILNVIFTERSSRSERLLNRQPVLQLSEGLWQTTGMSNLRVLAEHFQVDLPPTGSVTVAGVIQEALQRLPQVGDRIEWGPFAMEVTETVPQQPIVVQLRRLAPPEIER